MNWKLSILFSKASACDPFFDGSLILNFEKWRGKALLLLEVRGQLTPLPPPGRAAYEIPSRIRPTIVLFRQSGFWAQLWFYPRARKDDVVEARWLVTGTQTTVVDNSGSVPCYV
ncbi:hypothetical protein AVEN_246566-1 [Araneus ventricosus]|uniref:Uncharacterized protein n=1 Tax=Araneus ventricosus TaxID=182803 RepID=A0A4Y2DEC7_ARAVE|nr:hypothetical protein AVEN_246566-1 [Araneus ventricosus]